MSDFHFPQSAPNSAPESELERLREQNTDLLLALQEVWQPMGTAPKDGTMLRLLVQFDENATDDSAEPCPTIGANNFDHDGLDDWRFAGWCWSHDVFTEGVGTPVGWLPMVNSRPAANSRQVNFVQVTSSPDFLRADLGDRRFWPVEAGTPAAANAGGLPADPMGDRWHSLTCDGSCSPPCEAARPAEHFLKAAKGALDGAQQPAQSINEDQEFHRLLIAWVRCHTEKGDYTAALKALINHIDGRSIGTPHAI
jgi:hypothetical protein